MAHLGLGRFLLVGQAYGGFGAFRYALDNPETLRALVVTNSMGGIREIAAERASVVAGRSVEERELGDSYRAANPEGVRRWLAIEHGNDRRRRGSSFDSRSRSNASKACACRPSWSAARRTSSRRRPRCAA